MKQKKLWALAVFFIIIICGVCVLTCSKDGKENPVVSPTDDSSQFVTITDVVPDVILEIRYFSTYNFVGSRIDGYENLRHCLPSRLPIV